MLDGGERGGGGGGRGYAKNQKVCCVSNWSWWALRLIYCAKTTCPVVNKEELFNAIATCHVTVGHAGRDKTWAEVHGNYSGVKHGAIDLFLRTCSQRQVVKSLPSSNDKPDISSESSDRYYRLSKLARLRLQMDFACMRLFLHIQLGISLENKNSSGNSCNASGTESTGS